MDKLLKIYDDLIPLSLADKIEEITTGREMKWYYLDNLVDDDYSNLKEENIPYIPGFAKYIVDQEYNFIDTKYVWLYSQVLYILANKLNFFVNQILTERLFLQTPTNIDVRLDPHIDQPKPHLVCLYYINDSDGDTTFFDDCNNVINKVSPKKGRIALFDGFLKHSAGIPKTNTRFVLNINFTTDSLQLT